MTLVNAARDAGVPLIIISGRRSTAHNERVGGAPASWHLQGLAFDVQVQGYRVADIPEWWWSELGAVGESLGLRWGGRFASPDLNHFDYPMGVATPLPAPPPWSDPEPVWRSGFAPQAPELDESMYRE